MKVFLEYKIKVEVPKIPDDVNAIAILDAIDADQQLASALEMVQRRLETIVPDAWNAKVTLET